MTKNERMEIIHQEACDTLPQQAEEAMITLAAKQAQRKGITLHNSPVVPEREGLSSDNQVMLQSFEWYLPDDGQHWDRIKKAAPEFKALGIGGVWLPPCCKATGSNDVGYGVYDLYDLGEFDQKGSVRTKYGTRQQLEAAIAALHEQGMQVYGDVVLNHKGGADETELFQAVKVNPENRQEEIAKPQDIKGWTRFTFPGRQGKYSKFQWGFQHFTAVDHDDITGENGIFRILGDNKGFSQNVSHDKGNFDYLMFSDVDYRNKEAIEESIRWGEWFVKTLQLDGLRLDAIKHINASFISAFLREMRLRAGKQLYCVGEYLNGDENLLAEYIGEAHDQLALFDVALHFNFYEAASRGSDYDLRQIFSGSLLEKNSFNVVTFVDNHDSQPGQPLGSWVNEGFKPLAYALILLRRDGYPCLFWGDYFGTGGESAQRSLREQLDPLLEARKRAAYGEQVDYFDDPHCIGWLHLGEAGRSDSGVAVVMSNAGDASKRMSLGELNKGTAWRDITGHNPDSITLDDTGAADFPCKGGSVSVYVRA